MESNSEVDKKQVILKLLTGSTGGLLAFSAVLQLISGVQFTTQFFICVYFM